MGNPFVAVAREAKKKYKKAKQAKKVSREPCSAQGKLTSRLTAPQKKAGRGDKEREHLRRVRTNLGSGLNRGSRNNWSKQFDRPGGCKNPPGEKRCHRQKHPSDSCYSSGGHGKKKKDCRRRSSTVGAKKKKRPHEKEPKKAWTVDVCAP